MRKLLTLLMLLGLGFVGSAQVYDYQVQAADILQADNHFVWQGDTIRKDSIVYAEDKVDSIRFHYINGTKTKWYWSRGVVKNYADSKVSNAAYGSTWSVVTTVAPSEQAIYNKIETIVPVSYCPTTMTINTGTLVQGTVTDLCAVGGTDVIISENTGADPLRVTFEFNPVARLTSFSFYGRYNGGAAHVTYIEAYNYTAAAWQLIGELGNTAEKQWQSYNIFLPTNFISTGTVQVRFNHQGNGINTHQLILDYVDVNYGGAGGSSFETASEIAFIPNGNIESTNVQAALQELDAEKEPVFSKGNLVSGTSSVTVTNGTGRLVGGTATITVNFPTALPTPNALTMNNSGTGDASGATFNGSEAKTISYNTIGAEPAFSKNTAFNKNFGTTAGTVLEGRTFGTAANNNTVDFLPNQYSKSLNGQDFNTVIDNGLYTAYSPLNSPSGSSGLDESWMLLRNTEPFSEFGSELALSYYGANRDRFFFRTKIGSSWGSYKELWHSGNFTPTDYAPESGSGNYIQNVTIQQPTSNFNISGSGVLGSTIQATTGKFTNLTDGYLPYHISDASGFGNSPIWSNGTIVSINNSVDYGLANLQVKSSISAYSTDNSTTPYLFLVRNVGINGVGVFNLYDGGNLGFDTGATGVEQTERMRILGTNGNVGIGYSTGAEITNNKLAVNGSGYFNGTVDATSYKQSTVDLRLSPLRSGFQGASGTIPVSSGATTDFNWSAIKTINGNSILGSGDISISGATNLSTTTSTTTVTINSDTGTYAIIPAATTTAAGVLTASDKTKLDGIAEGADNYGSWGVSVDGTTSYQVNSFLNASGKVDFLGGDGIATSYGTSGGRNQVTSTLVIYELTTIVNPTLAGFLPYTTTGTNAKITLNTLKATIGSTAGTADLLVMRDGSGDAYAHNFILSSDRRLKKNIKPLSNTEWTNKVQFKEFKFKNDPANKTRFGIIAQDIEKIAPELVSVDSEGNKSVAYIDMLIAKVSEMDKKIIELEKRIEKLEKK